MCKFPLTVFLQIICEKFFAKLVQSISLCHRRSKKLMFIKIWQLKVSQNKDYVCYRKKQSFRQCAWGLRQLVLKPGFRPKGRALGIYEKSENFNSLRPILFELCKKNYRRGSNWPPPPAGIGLTYCSCVIKRTAVVSIKSTADTDRCTFNKLISQNFHPELWDSVSVISSEPIIYSGAYPIHNGTLDTWVWAIIRKLEKCLILFFPSVSEARNTQVTWVENPQIK